MLRVTLAFAVAGMAAVAPAQVTSSWSGGLLTITAGEMDDVTVTAVNGEVKVNGADPDTGPVAPNLVNQLEITAGDGANEIDLSAVTFINGFGSGSFLRATVQSGGGDDVILGTDGNDVLEPGAGQDSVEGLRGNDTVISMLGGDADFVDGGLGIDRVELSAAAAFDVTLRAMGAEVLLIDETETPVFGIESVESLIVTGSPQTDALVAESLAGTTLGLLEYAANGGSDMVDLSASNVTLSGEWAAGDGPLTLIGGGSNADSFFVGAPNDDSEQDYTISPGEGNTIVITSADSSVDVTLGGIDNISLNAFGGDDTAMVNALPDGAARTLNLVMGDGDDSVSAMASGVQMILNGAAEGEGDALIVDVNKMPFNDNGSFITGPSFELIRYQDFENVTIINEPVREGDQWQISGM